jgi:hypothetical protein
MDFPDIFDRGPFGQKGLRDEPSNQHSFTTTSKQPDKFALQGRPFIHELASKCKLHQNHAMKNHPLRILNKRCLQSIRILNVDRLDVAVEFLLRALLVVLKRVDSRGKLSSILILARSATSATSIAIS